MPNVSVEIARRADAGEAVRVARTITGDGIATIRRAINDGVPIYSRELFLNDFAEVADELRGLAKGLRLAGVPFVIREDGHPISEAALNSILAASDQHRR